MKKIPLELVTSLVKAENFSPVIWDGYDLVVSQNDDYNLQKIASKVASLITKAASAEAQLNNQRQDLNKIGPNVNMLMQAFPDIQTRMSGIEVSISGNNGALNRLTTMEARIADVEADINSIVSGGVSGSGGGLSTTYSNILAALNNGSYISGGTNISVEKLTSGSNAGSYRISFTGSLAQSTVASANNYIVVTSTGNNYTIEFNTSELINYIGAGKGLQVDSAFQNKIVITPKNTLVRGDGSTIDVKFDSVAGEFTVRSLVTGGGSSGGSVSADGKTIISDSSGVLSVAPDAVNANVYPFAYESANFYGTTVTTSGRFSSIPDTSIYGQLPQDKLATNSAVASSELSAALKSGVFNTSGSTMLSGMFYMLNDFNSVGSVVVYPVNAQSIGANAASKTLVFDVDFQLRMEYINSPTIRYGNTFQFTERNLIFPFYLYWITNTSKNATALMGGEVLRFASPTGDGFGALATHHQRHIIKASDLAGKNLDTGILQMYVMVGFKVAASADSIFTAGAPNKYLIEPRLNAVATYL